ncbi:hypothetical protein E1262_21065 [Jiangella aurantiaca]|uniref:Uncharacterized protein n=1 Tax=Jiangella aurantiaca TaxID=2530373 RepID=A0A4R5A4H3_9ACTN|nr:DUF6328 family protein [Jiangella aurantiaca]TDD66823.1 hypothetical protein E1262_21065 [Jiangella aurantiaca]
MTEQRYRRDEDQADRYDRHWNELLQELRIAQTGVQILFAFLLTIAFTSPFRDSDEFTHDVFAVTIVVAAMSMALLIAPVSFHRIVFRKRIRDKMIPMASKMTAGGLFLLMLAVCGGLLLALDVVLARWLAIVVSGTALLWFVTFWYVIPGRVRARSTS